jgi:hypothetical protein
MASVGDMERLNHCLTTLDSTDLGQSMVWLWTWSTIKSAMADEQYKFNLTELQVWEKLCLDVKDGIEFTLEYGAEDHYEHVIDWLINNGVMIDMMFTEEEVAV